MLSARPAKGATIRVGRFWLVPLNPEHAICKQQLVRGNVTYGWANPMEVEEFINDASFESLGERLKTGATILMTTCDSSDVMKVFKWFRGEQDTSIQRSCPPPFDSYGLMIAVSVEKEAQHVLDRAA